MSQPGSEVIQSATTADPTGSTTCDASGGICSLPRIGMIDDALVMAVACELGRDGIKRYCVWKGIAPALARRVSAGR